MSVTVVTGWTGRGYDGLGQQFCSTFARGWPVSVALSVLTDAPHHPLSLMTLDHRRTLTASSLSKCDGLAEFIARHKDNPAAHGREPNGRWKPKERAIGYSWRYDAVKFATQLFIPDAASKQLSDGEILVWFDADVVTKNAVPERFIEGLLGDSDVVFLGRPPKHSEIGFWALRLSPKTRAFLEYLTNLYRTDAVFGLKEWHSAFVWDEARRTFENSHGMRSRNLTPRGRGHVWPTSPLGRYTEHLKGERKLSSMRSAA